MKKIFLFLTTMLLMLASCSDKVVVDYGTMVNTREANSYINFGTNLYVPSLTKAIIEDSAGLQVNNLAVYAKINGDLNALGITLDASKNGYFIYGDTLAYANSKWALKNKRYFWPNAIDNDPAHDPTLDFYSFGPIELDGTITEAGGIISVDVDTKGRKDSTIQDLVYAQALNQTYLKNNTENKGTVTQPAQGYVKFEYEHQLSWIEFKAKYTTEFDTLILNSIKVNVDTTEAVFKIDTTAHKGYLTDYALAADTFKLDTLSLDTIYQVVGGFVAIPQVVKDNMTATINYTAVIDSIEYKNREAVVKLNTGLLAEDGTVPATWNVASWKKGYKYVYRINIKWREILFDVSVTNWDTNVPGGSIPSEYLIY